MLEGKSKSRFHELIRWRSNGEWNSDLMIENKSEYKNREKAYTEFV